MSMLLTNDSATITIITTIIKTIKITTTPTTIEHKHNSNDNN